VSFGEFAEFVRAFQGVFEQAARAWNEHPDALKVRRVSLASPLVIEIAILSSVSVTFLAAFMKGFKRVFSYDLELRASRQETRNRFDEARRAARDAEIEERVNEFQRQLTLGAVARAEVELGVIPFQAFMRELNALDKSDAEGMQKFLERMAAHYGRKGRDPVRDFWVINSAVLADDEEDFA
jgi:hypothetical protein